VETFQRSFLQDPGKFCTLFTTLGLHISDQPGMKLGLGYSTSSTVAIPDHAEDVRVEISQRPGGAIIVDSPKAHLKQP
jgi:hypothetical protein